MALGSNRVTVQLLELSGYLENYLWPFFDSSSSEEHLYSILLIFGEKLLQDGIFRGISCDEATFGIFVEQLVSQYLASSLPSQLEVLFLRFVCGAFRSLDSDVSKRAILRYTSLPIWNHLSQSRLQREVSLSDTVKANWKKYSEQRDALKSKFSSSSKKKSTAADSKLSSTLLAMDRDANFIPTIIDRSLELLNNDSLDATSALELDVTLDLFTELLSQISTRRYLATLLDDKHFVLLSRRSMYVKVAGNNSKVWKLIDQIEDFLLFEVDDSTGKPITRQDLMERCNARISQLQQLAFAKYPELLRGLVFSSIGELTKKPELSKHVALLSKSDLLLIAKELNLYHDKDQEVFGLNGENIDDDFLKELIFEFLSFRPMLIERINKLPLYPTEELLWNEEFILSNSSVDGQVLAMPKLNLQFLTMYDYFRRNFLLFLMESAFEIRSDIMDCVKRMGPRQGPLQSSPSFLGWSRMALPIVSLTVDQIGKPWIGESVPRTVDCSVVIDLNRFSGDIRREWEDLREHDGKYC